MSVFADSEELLQIMTKLWQQIKADKLMSEQLVTSKLIVQFRYFEPNAVLTIDCSDGKELKIITGETDIKPTIEMSMKANLAHEFWLGKVNLPLAILTGKITSKGPTPKALALLPVIRPSYNLYPKILIDAGKESSIPK